MTEPMSKPMAEPMLEPMLEPSTGPMTANIALLVAYDGAPFSGFARQPNQPHVRTVQGALEAALETVLRLPEPPQTTGAGRTDAGVHARGQVVSVTLPAAALERVLPAAAASAPAAPAATPTPAPAATAALCRSLTALCAPGIVVRALQRVPADFSARFSALRRTYRYRIAMGSQPPLFTAPFVWHVPGPLDLPAMREAATLLQGEHDFASFCVSGSAAELHEKSLSTCRFVESISLAPEQALSENLLTIEVVGNAFLHSMVRVMVGTLVEVGNGARTPDQIPHILAACDRREAGVTAPACGLTFDHVDYGSALGW